MLHDCLHCRDPDYRIVFQRDGRAILTRGSDGESICSKVRIHLF